jgi:hypothetical protein
MLDARYLTTTEIMSNEFSYTGDQRTSRRIAAVYVIIYPLRISDLKIYSVS